MNFDKRYLFKKWASQAPIAPLIIDEPRLLAKLGCLTNRLISNPGKAFGSTLSRWRMSRLTPHLTR
jgi:hypothetical protein